MREATTRDATVLFRHYRPSLNPHHRDMPKISSEYKRNLAHLQHVLARIEQGICGYSKTRALQRILRIRVQDPQNARSESEGADALNRCVHVCPRVGLPLAPGMAPPLYMVLRGGANRWSRHFWGWSRTTYGHRGDGAKIGSGTLFLRHAFCSVSVTSCSCRLQFFFLVGLGRNLSGGDLMLQVGMSKLDSFYGRTWDSYRHSAPSSLRWFRFHCSATSHDLPKRWLQRACNCTQRALPSFLLQEAERSACRKHLRLEQNGVGPQA